MAETSCRFLKAVSFPKQLFAGLRLQELGNSSVIYDIGLFREQEEEPAALTTFVHVYVDARTRKTAPIPAPIRSVLATMA